MLLRLSAILIFSFALTVTYGQNYEPLDLAKKIFGKDTLVDIDNYVTGEYTGRPNGQDLKEGSITNFTLLEEKDEKSVVAMTVIDPLGNGCDIYLYFEKDSTWRMFALRSLAMTGVIEQVKVELGKMAPQQVDSIIRKSKKNKYSMFSSKSEYDFLLGNTELTLELDENIIKHFLANQAEFERMKNLALKEFEKHKMDEEREIKILEDIKTDYQKIFISSIWVGGYQFGNSINFLIGGMVDNCVGYLYVKDKKDLPEINLSRIIMIREIGNGWYLYKTT